MSKIHVSVNTLHWRRGRQRQMFFVVTRIYCLFVAWRTNEMFAPEDPNPDRARVRLRDIGAAWLLVVLIAASIQLPSVFTAARVEAVHAADIARYEIAMVLQAVPRLLHPIALRLTALASADTATGR